jgi:tetratricopeptide (TPR) repeat protein
VKLADFGIAHAFGREQEAETAELSVAAGTPLYMAPEQLHGQWREFGPRTDLYALGCIACELVCGRPPYDGESALAIANKHQNEPPPPLESRFPVPDVLEGWIHRAMAADPDRRFQRAADAAWALPRGVLAAGAGPERGDSEEATSSEPTGEHLAETQLEGLTATIVLDETADDDAPPALEEAPTQLPSSDGGDHIQRAETAAAVDAGVDVESVDQPGEPGRLLQALHPPLPSDWRPEHTDPIPAPLVGAGLGLFGLREPPFVDRREACDDIWQTLGRVVEQGGCESVFVAGEAGTGKSRLAEWMTTRAHEVGAARIVRAVHTPEGGASGGLRGALDRTLRTIKMDRGEVYQHLVETLPVLPEHEGDLVEDDARALTEYLRPTDDDAEHVDGPRYRFGSGRQKRALLVRTLDRLTARRPVILWLDDLQWGDEAIGVLETLGDRHVEPPQMMVLATVRSDIVAEQPNLADRLEALQADDGSTRLSLAPLAREHQRELLTGLLPLEQELADRLADRTEGHPLFAMQLLGHWIDGGDLEVGARGFRVPEGRTVELPDDIHQLWFDRLDRMVEQFGEAADDILETIELAAALGRQVDHEHWSRLLDDAGLAEPDGLVDRLVERGLAERTPDGWAFTHGMLVDSLARRAREAGRYQTHHRRCARTLQSALTGDELGPRERIAEHWVAAGRSEQALEPLLEEAWLYTRRGNQHENRSIMDRCGELLDKLGLPDDDPRRLEHRFHVADMMGRGEHVERSKSRLTAIWEQVDDEPRLQALCAQSLGRTFRYSDDLQRAREWLERALEAAYQSNNQQLQSRCHLSLAWTCGKDGEFDKADYHVDRGIERAREAGADFERLNGLRTRCYLRQVRGGDVRTELLETIRDEARVAGYLETEALVVNALGELARFAGRYTEARRHYRHYLKMMRQLDRPVTESVGYLNLGQVALREGELEHTAEYLREAEGLLETIGADVKQDLVHLLRLGHAAGTGDRETFADLWAPLADGWPKDWLLTPDHPWLLETIGEYAEEAGWEESAREVWKLGAELWEELGDEESAAELRRRYD